jgi:ATP-dependent Clp protease ATP-binding subunit ClpX
MEEVLLNTMYDLPGRNDVERVMIDRDVVEKRVNPTLVPSTRVAEPTERSA